MKTIVHPTNDRVEAFMQRKQAEPGFGKRRFRVRVTVGRVYVTLHKAARTGQ